MLSKEELKHLAHLARLGLSEKELKNFQGDLSRIVDFVGQLTEVDTAEEGAGKNITGLESIFQEDKEHGQIKEKGPGLIKQSPKDKDSFVVAPEVFDSSQ